MRLNRSVTTFALVALTVVGMATLAFAVKTRGASQNGVNSNAPSWLLLGRNRTLTLTGNGKSATMRREIVCPDGDVEASEANPNVSKSGGCDQAHYMFIFQFQSTANNLSVVIGNLQGFDGTNLDNFGVMICDSSTNTLELCTNDPTITHIPDITTTTTSTSVTFTVPNAFPNYPSGTSGQGTGLTFFVITTQSTPLSVAVPTVGIR